MYLYMQYILIHIYIYIYICTYIYKQIAVYGMNRKANLQIDFENFDLNKYLLGIIDF